MTDTQAAPALERQHHLQILRPDPTRPATVIVDGVDVSPYLSGVQLVADPTGIRAALEVHPRSVGAAEFEGLAVVVVETEATDPGPAAAMFLGAMDAGEIERAALARLAFVDDGGEHATTRAILALLIDLANGQDVL